MNRLFSLDQLRSLRRPEALLVLILVVALVAWNYIDGKASDADAELLVVENNVFAVQDDLRFWTTNFDQLTLQSELAALLDTAGPPDLPTEQGALEFRTNFVAYASEQRLPLSSLEVSDITVNLGDTEFPAIRYSIVVSGSLDALIGSLRIFELFPTASLQSMEFFRAEQGPNIWGLSMTLDVLHQPEEA